MKVWQDGGKRDHCMDCGGPDTRKGGSHAMYYIMVGKFLTVRVCNDCKNKLEEELKKA